MQSVMQRSLFKIFIIVILVSCAVFVVMRAKGQGNVSSADIAKAEGKVVLKIGSPMAFNGKSLALVDSENQGIFPFVNEGNTYVPLRFISEGLGAKIKWDAEKKAVMVDEKSTHIIMPIDALQITVNGKDKSVKTAAQMYDGRVFVPLRELSNAIGYHVFYENESGLIIVSKDKLPAKLTADRDFLDGLARAVTAIPIVGSKANLKKLIGSIVFENAKYGYTSSIEFNRAREVQVNFYKELPITDSVAYSKADMALSLSNEEMPMGARADDYSKTNVQVEDVDEADIVKTDGEYIYSVSRQKVAITRAYPAEELEVVHLYNDDRFNPQELYINGDKLIIIGTKYGDFEVSEPTKKGDKKMTTDYTQCTVVCVVDVSDKTAPKIVKEVSIEGEYETSRMVGNRVYVVAEQCIRNYNDEYRIKNDEWRPIYSDSTEGGKAQYVDYDEISYLPDTDANSYLITAGIELNNLDDAISMNAILGTASTVYASADNMYVVSARVYYAIPAVARDVVANKKIARKVNQPQVIVYKFSLKNLKTEFVASGNVEGTVLNQFSMDEHNGYFRIATTSNSSNNMFVLDETLRKVGEITGIAKGERIYSVRFMGKKAYMVTFRETDPLFVINMADPKNPFVEGELKIPGYSDYLHPYDDNHLIGFGRQTDGVQGLKLSMFDVSDVKKPKELFNTVIPNAYSELNSNHKALLFSKEKDIFAFPATVYSGEIYHADIAFFGLFVYGIDLEKGFIRKAKITHGSDAYGYIDNIRRALYIGDALYTVSDYAIKATALSDFKDIKRVDINHEE